MIFCVITIHFYITRILLLGDTTQYLSLKGLFEKYWDFETVRRLAYYLPATSENSIMPTRPHKKTNTKPLYNFGCLIASKITLNIR